MVFVHSIKMVKLSLKELKAVAKIRGIKGYKSMSEDELLSALISLKPVKKVKRILRTQNQNKFSKPKIEKIRKEFNESRHKFSKSKINEIRRNPYDIENEKNLFAPKTKEIERNVLELAESISKSKKYYDYYDTEYEGIRDVKDLFDLSIDEDYHKPKITKGSFNNSYIQYESIGDKVKSLSIKKYLDTITPYFSDIINNHKTQGK